MDKKIAVIGDLHLGLGKDSPIFHKIALDFAFWLNEECNKRGVKQIIQAGDWFHSRTNIALPTLNCSSRFLTILKDKEFHTILGNHCNYYNDSCEIHSLSLLKDKPLFNVYDTPTRKDDFFFAPWATRLEQIESCRVLISHADVQSFTMGGGKVSTHGFRGIDLAEKADLTLLGHYHCHQERRYKTSRNTNARVMYLGSCFQHDFGECENIPHIFFLDTETLQIEAVENKISPRFCYIRGEKDIKKAKGNFVSIVAPDIDTLEKITQKVSLLGPIRVDTEIVSESFLKESSENQIQSFKAFDLNELTVEFIKENFRDDLQEDIQKEALSLIKTL